MRSAYHCRPLLFRSLLAILLVGGLACSTDSPTAPTQGGGTTPAPTTIWNITVTADPTVVNAGSSQPSTIRIVVRRQSDNSAPPDGATAVLSTTLGEFNSAGSGVQSGAVALVGGQGIVSFFGGTSEGTATIQARLESSSGVANVQILGTATFFLNSIVPNFGSPQGGEQVEIIGGGFEPPVRVTFGNLVAQVDNIEQGRILVTTPVQSVPVGQTLTVSVQVTVNFGGENQATDTLPSSFTYSAGSSSGVPQIFSITPTSGPNEGGTRIVINGEGFDPPSRQRAAAGGVQVLFGTGSSATAFQGVEASLESVSNTQIVAITPAATAFGQNNLNQTVDVMVKNIDSGLAAIAPGSFSYGVQVIVTSVGPGESPWFGDQIVTIFGQGFDEPVAVGLAGHAQPAISVTGTEIIVRTAAITPNACSDETGTVTVTNIETGNGNAQGPTFRWLVPAFGPSISSISPGSGSSNGGTNVTITGNNFRQPLRVEFGDDRPGNITSVPNTSTINVITPSIPVTELETESCDANNDGQEGERYIDTPVDVTVTSLTTTCESLFKGGFIYKPADTSCRNDVAPPAPPDPPVAAFTWFVVANCLVQFQDASTGDVSGVQWDFTNDGVIDTTARNPQFDYSTLLVGACNPADPPGTYGYAARFVAIGSFGFGNDEIVQQISVP